MPVRLVDVQVIDQCLDGTILPESREIIPDVSAP
jgi:hypothetical protein